MPPPAAKPGVQIPRVMAISAAESVSGTSLAGTSLAGTSLATWLQRVEGLVDYVQLREKHLDDREVYELATALPASTRIKVLVNGRPDIAHAAGCRGVHLPSTGLPVAAVRAHFGKGMVIGRSTHHPDEVAAAKRAGADFVLFGPIFPTPSKLAFGPPLGLAGLRRATSHGLPVVAIGGIGPEQIPAVAAAGGAGVAGIRAFQDLTQLRSIATTADRYWPSAAGLSIS